MSTPIRDQQKKGTSIIDYKEVRLRVLLVAPTFPYPPHRDGTSKVVSRLLRINTNFQADVLCPVSSTDQLDAFPKTARLHAVCRVRRPFSATVKWIQTRLPRNVVAANWDALAIRKKLLCVQHNYDVIHFISHLHLPILRDIPVDVLRKTIIAPLDCYCLLLQRRRECESNPLLRLLLSWELNKVRKYEREYYTIASPCVFVSSVDSAYVSAMQPKVITAVVPLGIDTDYYCPQNKKKNEPKLVLFCGNMAYAANIDAAIFLAKRVMPLVYQHIPSVRLLIAGASPTRQVISLKSELVKVVGNVPDMRDYIAACELFVCPLRYGSGMKNKVLEAMAIGKAVVVSKVGADGIDWSGDAPFLLLADMDPTLWAQAIVELLNDNTKRTILGSKARVFVCKNYSVDSEIERYARLYNEKICRINDGT